MSSLMYPSKSKTVLFSLYLRSVIPMLFRLPSRLPTSYPQGVSGVWYVLTHLDSLLKPKTIPPREELYAHLRAAFSITVASLSLLSRVDEGTQKLLNSVPCGLLSFEVPEAGVSFWVHWDRNQLTAEWGKSAQIPTASIHFKSAVSAFEASQQKLDELSAIGNGDLEVKGFLPLADGMNGVMNRVAFYLQ